MVRWLNRIQLFTYNTPFESFFLVIYVLVGVAIAIPLSVAQKIAEFF